LLKPDTPLTGRVKQDLRPADVGAVINAIHFAEKEEADRLLRKQMHD
jgi:RIO kinase 1